MTIIPGLVISQYPSAGVAFESIAAPRFLLLMVVVSSNSNSVRPVIQRTGYPGVK